jgi:hypothetical protein
LREIKGNLWKFFGQNHNVVLITTNGMVKKNGEAVMGRGCAFQATQLFPGIAKVLGHSLQNFGNHVALLRSGLWSFPVKHNWYEEADLKLIAQSTEELRGAIEPTKNYYLPRPGCGNGKLKWEDVKPIVSSLPDNVFIVDFA